MSQGKRRTILLVDDDALVIAVMQHTLAHLNWEVLVAGDGREALALHGERIGDLDLLITDLQMPFINGKQLAKHLREKRPTLPILFMSGDSGVEPLPTEAEFPGHIFLHKPFLPSDLLAILTR